MMRLAYRTHGWRILALGLKGQPGKGSCRSKRRTENGCTSAAVAAHSSSHVGVAEPGAKSAAQSSRMNRHCRYYSFGTGLFSSWHQGPPVSPQDRMTQAFAKPPTAPDDDTAGR